MTGIAGCARRQMAVRGTLPDLGQIDAALTYLTSMSPVYFADREVRKLRPFSPPLPWRGRCSRTMRSRRRRSSSGVVVGEQSHWSFANHCRKCRQKLAYSLNFRITREMGWSKDSVACPAHWVAYKLHAVRLPFPASCEKLPGACRLGVVLVGSCSDAAAEGIAFAGESARA
jgi:hypothetical protein